MVTIRADGPFSFASAAAFLRGFAPAAYASETTSTLRLAFVAERSWTPVGIEVHGTDDGIRVEVATPAPVSLRDQVARMFSLDVDGRGFEAIGARDPVIADLQIRFFGLRPVCFPSAYESAVWGVLSHRVRMSQAARIKRGVAQRYGTAIDVGGETLHAFPTPDALLALDAIDGVPALKLERLHGVARAALDGLLDGAALRASEPRAALARLMTLPGVGPFTAELVLIRGAGAPDVQPTQERRLRRAVELAYGPGTTLEAVAEAWRPFRSWCSVLLRAWLEIDRRRTAARPTATTDMGLRV